METKNAAPAAGWVNAWPDALGFAVGLALAWWMQWETRDLVWSLWLSSLLVGYAMILWSIFSPAWLKQREGRSGEAVATLVGGVFLLVFFTFHFGLFHFVHSAFLNGFFPLVGGERGGPSVALYAVVLERYWWFVPLALLAERQAFRLVRVAPIAPEPPPTSVKAADIAQRRARQAQFTPAGDLMAPYKNVVRLHLLIFFFAGAHFLRLDSFLVYAVVYAVYFFPWRLLLRGKTPEIFP